MRHFFTTADALARGKTMAELKWGDHIGTWRRIGRGAYGSGHEDPSELDWAIADVLRGGTACGVLAGLLHGLDAVTFGPGGTRRRRGAGKVVTVHGVPCTDGLQTMIDLAAALDDDRWEQALESALRKRLTSVRDLEATLATFGRSRTPGTARIRRVLARRPVGAPPTESLLETLMVQLARRIADLPDPIRQYEVSVDGRFVARVDLCWPSLGLFLELDGQHHKDQPVYDARRETAVVAATGWLCARFTWTELVRVPTTTQRRLAAIVDRARQRPMLRA